VTELPLGPGIPLTPTPLYEAQNAPRYERQSLIRAYQEQNDCSLIVVGGPIFQDSVIFFEELIFDADPDRDLHVMISSPGGDGEIALRLVRSAQQRCRNLTVVLPDQAKSAATLFALGAHAILMGPTSDLGPVDPQFRLENSLVSAKDIVAAVDDAAKRIQEAPETYPLYASLLSNVTAIMVQQARSAIERSGDLVREALASSPGRTPEEVDGLVARLRGRLIDEPHSHAAVVSADDAVAAGLPVTKVDPASEQWQSIWRLWARYGVLGNFAIYEGERASQVFPLG
jgi:hypothetical protein